MISRKAVISSVVWASMPLFLLIGFAWMALFTPPITDDSFMRIAMGSKVIALPTRLDTIAGGSFKIDRLVVAAKPFCATLMHYWNNQSGPHDISFTQRCFNGRTPMSVKITVPIDLAPSQWTYETVIVPGPFSLPAPLPDVRVCVLKPGQFSTLDKICPTRDNDIPPTLGKTP